MHEHIPGAGDTGARRADSQRVAITWLHVSDLHHGQPGEAALWPQRLEAALEDMSTRASKLGPPDLILFTGDLTYSGQAHEFDRVDETLGRIRKAVGGNPLVVPVPGNHDLRRPPSTSLAARGLRGYLEDEEIRRSIWEKPGGDNENLAFLRQRFEAYEQWWQRRIVSEWRQRDLDFKEGLLPGDFRLTFEKDGFRLGLMGLNSAFLHLYGGCKGKLAVEPSQVPGFVDWARMCHAALLLMHHPLDWLHDNWQARLRREIYASDRFAACLFGHMHEPVDTREERNKQVRHWLQAASLCGLEGYEDPAPGTRRCGYAWGRIERVDAEPGQLTVWRRELAETYGGDLKFDRPQGDDEEESFPIPVRVVEVERTRTAVVVLPQHRTMALERFAEDIASADELFRQGRFAAAADAYRRIRDRIEAHGPVDADAELVRVLARVRLYVSASLLSLQDNAGAAEQAREIRAEVLEEADCVVLAQIWAQLRDFERARAVIASLDGDTSAPVRQLLAIEEVFANIEQGRPVEPSSLDRILAKLDDEGKNLVRRVLDGDSGAIAYQVARVRACALLVVCGRHDTAIRWALDLIAQCDDQPGLRAAAARVLLSGLSWSTNEIPVPCQRVATELLPRVITLLGHYFDPLQESLLSEAITAPELAELMACFQDLMRDRVRLEKACELMTQHGRDTRPFELRGGLDLEELKNLPAVLSISEHPWHERFLEAAWRTNNDEHEQARAIIAQLCDEFPGRMPLEWLAGSLWLAHGDFVKARTHAQRAYDAVPGHGQAILLGKTLLYTEDFQTVWIELREQLGGSPDIVARRILATAAFHAASDQALRCWRDVITHEQATASDFMRLSQSLYIVGEKREAVEVVGRALEHSSADSLTTNELIQGATLLLASSEPDRDRLLALAKRLLPRMQAQADAAAARWYVILREHLGRPPELPDPDLKELEALSVIQRMPRRQAEALRLEQARQWQRTLDGYYRGDIAFESVARHAGTREAELFSIFLDNKVPWTTPLILAGERIDIAGKELLLGVPEILLLDHLELLDALDQALGPDGRFILFDYAVENEILGSPAWFRVHDRQDEHYRLMALRERLAHGPRGLREVRRGDEPEDEAAWCEQRGFSLVSAVEGRGILSLDRVAEGLAAQGFLEPGRARQEQAPAASRSHVFVSLPERIALDALALYEAAQKGVLEELIHAFPGRMVITPHAWEQLERTIETLEIRRRAGERARRVRDWWTRLHRRGRIKVIAEPKIDLPPGRDGLDVNDVSQCIREAAVWRRALVDAPSRLLLRADFVSAQFLDEAVPVHLLQLLAWTTEFYAAAVAQSRAVGTQVLSFTALARSLAGARDITEKLRDLGFVDAYRTEELLDMARRFPGGLAAPGARPRLDMIEARARDERRNGWQHARRHLGALYATTIWTAWCDGEYPQREGVTTELLGRTTAIGYEGDVLRWLIYFLAAFAFQNPKTSFASDRNGQAVPMPTSRAGLMWSCVATSFAKQPVWRAVCEHALVDFLVTYDDALSHSSGPIAALLLAAEALLVETPEHSLIPSGSALEAIAILSARWALRPLSWLSLPSSDAPNGREISFEEILEQTVDAAGKGKPIYDAHKDLWDFSIITNGKAAYVALPPETVFLRATGHDLGPSLAAQLAKWRGPDDGRLVAPLAMLTEQPEHEQAARAFAHLAVAAPWRRFRADPRHLRTWAAERAGLGLQNKAPSSIHELRALLSEPEPLPEGKTLTQVIIDRVVRGPWQDRHDRQALVEIASETIPGLAWLYIQARHAASGSEQPVSELERAMERLLHAHEQPAARVASDIALCGFLAPDTSEETCAGIAQRIVQVLQDAASAPPPDSLAAFESALLRAAASTIWRLGGAAEPARDRLWLTWRLHQWVIRQLERVPAERRARSIELLLSAYPELDQLTEVAENDMLDPARFGHGRLDHRLIGILYTLAMIRPVFLQVLWSPPLETLLEELSARPFTEQEAWASSLPAPYSCLGWGDLPRTVPELARKVLDALHADIEDAVAASLGTAPQDSDRK